MRINKNSLPIWPCKIRTNSKIDRITHLEALREALLQGAGIGRTPTFIVGPDIAKKRLLVVLGEYQLPATTIYALFPKRQYLPAKVRVFVDFVVECLGGDIPYWDVQL